MDDRDRYKKEYTTLGIAAAGVYATAPSKWSDTAAHLTIYDSRLTPYLGDLAEGGVVFDKRPCVDRDDFCSMVVSGPMLKESLPSGHYQDWDRKVVPVTSETKLGGFDYIALDVYLDIWRKAGAKIGIRKGDSIHWESGEVFPIPPEENRYNHAEHG